jgi:hypothetical protein
MVVKGRAGGRASEEELCPIYIKVAPSNKKVITRPDKSKRRDFPRGVKGSRLRHRELEFDSGCQYVELAQCWHQAAPQRFLPFGDPASSVRILATAWDEDRDII